ncbi:MAG: CPBP family intramembrane metalloprotease [Eubacterium sp.]|nr:CPBP family intramembrane metalloprotease [Eubacterium sp.]
MKRRSQFNIIIAVFVLLTALFITVITYFAAFALTVILGAIDVTDVDTATVDQGIFNLLRFMVAFIIFGYWYHRIGFTENELEKRKINAKAALKFIVHPLRLLFLILLGVAIQLGTDGILYVLSNSFPAYFESYKEMITEFAGNRSVLYLITVIVLSPIIEELIFRGLVLHYARNAFSSRRGLIVANIFQALLFALYHGNLIQGVYAFIFGLLLGYITIKTDSLVINILLHMIINGSLYIIPGNLFGDNLSAVLISAVSLSVIFLSVVYLSFAISSKLSTYSDIG